MDSLQLVNTFASYVPKIVLDRIIEQLDKSSAEVGASKRSYPCVVLYADIKGFTQITETLAEKGPAGAEELTRILNQYFGRLISTVHDHQGDVAKFAGDAFLALWPITDNTDQSQFISQAVLACACGLAIQHEQNFLLGKQEVKLEIKVSIGTGEIAIFHVGGIYDRWEFIVAGEPLEQISEVDKHVMEGKVGLSEYTWNLVQQMDNGAIAVPSPSSSSVYMIDHLLVPPAQRRDSNVLDVKILKRLRKYLPGAITHRLEAGHTNWLGELRYVTVLFINLPDLHYSTSVQKAQEVMRSLQTCLYRFEGSINKLSIDDKGVSLLAVMGLPPLAHEDDAERGVKVAIDMRDTLKEIDLRCSIGVATGSVFCGAIGNAERREYTVMGDKVNLAARLMQAADNDILCDQTTQQRSADIILYSEPKTINLKGIASGVITVKPLSVKSPDAIFQSDAQALLSDLIIGRKVEQKQLLDSLTTVVNENKNQVVIVQGEPGIGKSKLLQAFVASSKAYRNKLYQANASSVERNTPYYVWQTILTKCFDLPDNPTSEQCREKINPWFKKRQELEKLKPLLNDFLPIELAETNLTNDMADEVRAANTQGLIIKLMQDKANKMSLILVIDDVHWMDSVSWSLMAQICQHVHPIMVVMFTRPLGIHPPLEFSQLVASPYSQLLYLNTMSDKDILNLVAHRLGVISLPSKAAEIILESGGGHPFFSEEIGYSLNEKGIIKIEAGRCRMVSESADIDDLPKTIQGVITGRIDRLDPDLQLTLKVASVIGREFDVDLLCSIHPVSQDSSTLNSQLVVLESLDFLYKENECEDNQHYIFKHIIVQQVAYDLMLYSQRSRLHRAVASYYEEYNNNDLSLHYSLLAFHWTQGEDAIKAAVYLERAAEQALKIHANTEVIKFLHQAQKLAKQQSGLLSSKLRQARWDRMLGESESALGNYPIAQKHLENALRALDEPVPEGGKRLYFGLYQQMWPQLLHRVRGIKRSRLKDLEKQRFIEAARACERLFLIYYFGGQSQKLLYTTLLGINLLEKINLVNPTLARLFGNLCLLCGAIPSPSQAAYYGAKALELANNKEGPQSWKAWVYLIVATYDAGVGDWEKAESLFNRAIPQAEKLGDGRRQEELIASLSTTLYLRGYFEQSSNLADKIARVAVHRGDAQAEGWGIVTRGRALYILQDYIELSHIMKAFKKCLKIYGSRLDNMSLQDYYALSALMCLHQDQSYEASEWIEKALKLAEEMGRPTQYHILPALTYVADSTVMLWKRWKYQNNAKSWAVTALKNLRIYANIFPIGKTYEYYIKGYHEKLLGNENEALDCWYQSADYARKYKQKYQIARSLKTIANHLPKHDENKYQLNEEAESILQDLNVELNLY